MTISDIGVLCPQPVDRAWGRRCGPVRSVAPVSTNGDRYSSTCGVDAWGKTRGYRCGRLGKTSYVNLTVDGRRVWPPLVHRMSTPSDPTWTAATQVIPRFHSTEDDDVISL